jgi:hypothetical protein
MAQMRFAYSADSFGTQHAVSAVNAFFDGALVAGLVKTGQ